MSRQRNRKCKVTASSTYRRFALLCIVPVVLWWHTLAATFALALHNDAYTHILLVLPMSVALIFLKWTSRKARPEPNFRAGSALLVLAALIGVIGSRWWGAGSLPGDARLSLAMLAVATWWIGAFVGCFGTHLFRMCIFPLGFLLWLVPMPQFALDRIVSFLQQGSASAADLLFAAAGVPVAHDGVVLLMPGLTIEVAKECSSIRSSLMLVVTTMVLAHVLLRSNWGKVLVSVAAIPLSIAKNGLRIFTLSMLGIYVDPSYLHGRLHHDGGIVFFLLSLAGLFALLAVVRWAERKMTSQPAINNVVPAMTVLRAKS